MAIRNFTKYQVNIRFDNGDEIAFPSEGHATCSSFVQHLSPIEGIQRRRISFGSVVNLPHPSPGVYYIVDHNVFQALAGIRSDVLIPEIDMSRDITSVDEPKIIFAKRFISY